jgi:hypothetical protein
MERSAIRVNLLRGETFPDFASLHPGYKGPVNDERESVYAFSSTVLNSAGKITSSSSTSSE